MTAAKRLLMTHAEYLAAEATSSLKHEFLAGEVLDMSGGTLEHSALSASVTFELKRALANRPCIVFESNARIRHTEADFSCYPDVSVVRGPVVRAADDSNAISNPLIAVEVLSDSTESWDRGVKSRQYRSIPSLRELVFVSQARRHVEVWRRNAAGRFELFEWLDGAVELSSIGVSVSVAAIYSDAEALRAHG